MSYLIKNVKIINLQSPFHLQKMDVLIEKGFIQKILKKIDSPQSKLIEGNNLCLSNGLTDLNCHIYQPGYEYREDMKTGLAAAANGGYTTVAIMPNTSPVIDTKGQVAYLKSLASNNLVEVVPIGAISKDCKGKDLAEIYDMQSEEIYCFSDGSKSISNSGMMERALLYVKKFDGIVMNHPDVDNISHGGLMNEGVLSTKLGLQASPKLAEELMVARDIYLAEHSESRLHFINISTANSVKQIKEAKKKGIHVTASVNAYNLLLDESFLQEYDTNFKVNPHLRTKEDIKALLKGLKDGTIDVISSGHNPKHQDEKKVEFENADFGISALDSAFAVARKATEKTLKIEELIEKMTIKPREILNLNVLNISEGEKANILVFDSEEEFVFEEKDIDSKSKNTPFVGMNLKGKIKAVFNHKKVKI